MYVIKNGFFDIHELNEFELRHIETLIIEISRDGVVDYTSPAWKIWQKETKPQHPLLDYSTIFVQRLGLAAIEFYRQYR